MSTCCVEGAILSWKFLYAVAPSICRYANIVYDHFRCLLISRTKHQIRQIFFFYDGTMFYYVSPKILFSNNHYRWMKKNSTWKMEQRKTCAQMLHLWNSKMYKFLKPLTIFFHEEIQNFSTSICCFFIFENHVQKLFFWSTHLIWLMTTYPNFEGSWKYHRSIKILDHRMRSNRRESKLNKQFLEGDLSTKYLEQCRFSHQR